MKPVQVADAMSGKIAKWLKKTFGRRTAALPVGQAQREWETALDAVEELIFIHDADMCIVRANRAYAARAGKDIRDIIGKPYWNLFPKLDSPLPGCRRSLEERQGGEEQLRLDSGEEYVSRIARELGLAPEHIHGIRLAGTVHDVGKIGVPAEILSKPGQLNDIEFSLIKLHPTIGYEILKDVEFPWPIAQMVLQHHERLDGSGYPAGLKGEQILLETRILSVADVVEAMFSFRPYRPGLGIEKALAEIDGNRGVVYDPQVVDACLRLFKERGFSFDPVH